MVDVRTLTDVGSDTDDGIVHLAIGQRATVRDDGVLNLAVLNLGRRQISRRSVDWRIRVVEFKVRLIRSQVQVRFEKGLDGSNVLPVIVKEVGLDVIAVSGGKRDDFSAEIVVVRVFFVQEFVQRRLLEDVDSHGGNVRLLFRFGGREAEQSRVDLHCFQRVPFRLFGEFKDSQVFVALHQTKVRRSLVVQRQHRDSDVRVRSSVVVDKVHVVHAVQVVTR